MGSRRGLPALMTLAALLGGVLISCGDDGGRSGGGDGGGGDGTRRAIATFQVTEEHGETFKIVLVTQELIDNAQLLLDGEEAPSIPVGKVIRSDPDGINAPWTWSIDPTTVEFADVTTEVCDGLPSDVEQDLITSPLYCPWSAALVDLQVQ